MRLTEVLGRAVIDPRTAHKVGVVDQIYVEPPATRVIGFRISTPEGEQSYLAGDQVARIGRQALMLRPDSTASLEQPEDEWIDMATITGLEVLGETGDRLGSAVDMTVDPATLAIVTVELNVPKMERFFGGGGSISVDGIMSGSREMLIVKSNKITQGAPAGERSLAASHS
jgi:sporulation protein YlmC with PRC-barrel domain